MHFYDFWFPEIQYKYIDFKPEDSGRYFEELQHKFHDLWRVIIYCIAFVFLSLHLLHGFQSAFQSTGFNYNKYTPIIKKIGNAYAIIVPSGFIFIALFHYFSIIWIINIINNMLYNFFITNNTKSSKHYKYRYFISNK